MWILNAKCFSVKVCFSIMKSASFALKAPLKIYSKLENSIYENSVLAVSSRKYSDMQWNTCYRFKDVNFIWVRRYLIIFLRCSGALKVHFGNIENSRSSESKIQNGSIFQGEMSILLLLASFGKYWRVVVLWKPDGAKTWKRIKFDCFRSSWKIFENSERLHHSYCCSASTTRVFWSFRG